MCLSEAKISHSQRMWAEAPSATPHQWSAPLSEDVFSGYYVRKEGQ